MATDVSGEGAAGGRSAYRDGSPDVPVLFGAAYYAEYQPYDRLKQDLDLMVEADFTVIRVGESVWSTWEPREGRYELDWLQPVLDGAHERGLRVIIGTPTYAVPPWLRRRYPETTAHSATGHELPYGGRQDVDYSHPAFRHLAERLVRAITGRYGDHPAVIGWQVDNEPGLVLLHNPALFDRFVERLRDVYGSVDELNRRWGLTYWSHRLADFSQLWVPDGNTTPSYDLAWRRFQADVTADFIAWQADLVRATVPSHHFVTTCLALGRPGQDVTTIGRPLDVVATNLYYASQDALAWRHDSTSGAGQLPDVAGWPPGNGPGELFLLADISRGTMQQPFLVTETNAASIGGPAENRPAWPGQWRQVAWALVARGARMVEYWHWHSLHYGNETYWGGVIGHSLEPGRCYDELAQIAAEMKRTQPLLRGLQPVSDVAMLVSSESRWAMSYMSPLAGGGSRTHHPSGWFGDPDAYDRILRSFYQGLFDVGLSVDVVAPHQLPTDLADAVSRWPVLLVPAAYAVGDQILEWLREYAACGGHLVLAPRTGYADEEAVVRHEVMPGILRQAAGVRYLESTSLAYAVPVHPAAEGAALAGAGVGWADALISEGADVLARYEHPFLGAYPAVTTHAWQAGRVTTVGTFPDRVLARALAARIAAGLPERPWRRVHGGSVSCTTARAADGSTLRFLHNWSWEPAHVSVPAAVTDLLSGAAIATAAELDLGPWEVLVLHQTHQTAPAATTKGEQL